jgi:hypothetical protein
MVRAGCSATREGECAQIRAKLGAIDDELWRSRGVSRDGRWATRNACEFMSCKHFLYEHEGCENAQDQTLKENLTLAKADEPWRRQKKEGVGR